MRLLLALCLFCASAVAQVSPSPVVQVVALEDAFVAIHADGSVTAAGVDGSVTMLGRASITVRGTSFDYVVPEDKAYKIHQDCANMTLATCIKRFRAAVAALRKALGLAPVP